MTPFDMVIHAAERTHEVVQEFANGTQVEAQDHRAVVQIVGAFGVFVNELYAIREREGL